MADDIADTTTDTDNAKAEKKTAAKSQKITVKTASKTYKQNTVRMAQKKFKIGASAKTALSYKVLKGKNYISVDKDGVVTIKKGLPCGTYKIRVTAKATKAYKKATKDVTITVTKSTPVMSKIPMKWDLKNNKTVTCTYAYGQYLEEGENEGETSITKSGTITLKNFKKTKGSKKNKVTFTLEYNLPADKLTQTEIDRAVAFGGYNEAMGSPDIAWGTELYFTAVDYQTGECLEVKNSYNVTVKTGKWKYANTKKYTTSDGTGWFQESQKKSIKVTIAYPKDYKDLCIVAGGSVNRNATGSSYFNGQTTFNKEKGGLWGSYGSLSKPDKAVCHGIRVK